MARCACCALTALLAADFAGAERPAAAATDQAENAAPARRPSTSARGAKAADPSVRVAMQAPPARFRGPDVTLIAGEERTVYEYRQNGQLRMIKVVPKFGPAYYLAPRDPTRGFGDLEQADSLVAEWVLREF